jgi:hypothetical protein
VGFLLGASGGEKLKTINDKLERRNWRLRGRAGERWKLEIRNSKIEVARECIRCEPLEDLCEATVG